MTVINGLRTFVPSVDYAIPVIGRLKERRYVNCDWLQQRLSIVGEKLGKNHTIVSISSG
ncbi:MAG: hypothetical protein M3M91_04970 [Thermoproteota archaeon]|nr:hypothetical protein [Thermoproteota archaeon]